jgi:hypothetical protein
MNNKLVCYCWEFLFDQMSNSSLTFCGWKILGKLESSLVNGFLPVDDECFRDLCAGQSPVSEDHTSDGQHTYICPETIFIYLRSFAKKVVDISFKKGPISEKEEREYAYLISWLKCIFQRTMLNICCNSTLILNKKSVDPEKEDADLSRGIEPLQNYCRLTHKIVNKMLTDVCLEINVHLADNVKTNIFAALND